MLSHRFQSIVDNLANGAIIVVSILALYSYGSRLLARPENPASLYQVGEKIEIPTHASRAVLISLRSTCRFCTDSMPLFKRLYEQAKRDFPTVRFIGVSAEPVDVTREYLRTHGVTFDDVISVPTTVRLVSFTPTVALVDGLGSVENLWAGVVHEKSLESILLALRTPKESN